MRCSVAAAALFPLLLVLGGCSRGPESEAGEVAPAPMQDLTITITNQNFYDATVYVLMASNRQRLGVAPSNGTATFTFPWRDPRIRFEIALGSAGSYLTEYISVSAGDALQYTVPPDAHRRIR